MLKPLSLTLIFAGLSLSSTLFAQKDLLNSIQKTELKTLQNQTVDFGEIAKKDKGLMIVSFWATWCKPCIQELDYLNDIYDELQDDLNTTVYAISIDDARSVKRVVPFTNGKGWNIEVLIDQNSELKRKMNVLNVPHTFIIDLDKRIAYEHTSYVPGDEDEYLEVLENLNK